jgi:deazaflavin-dependent oxidoreductase (nitroreductase family)
MTADREHTLRLPPRWFVRTAWVLHRAISAFTGGRFGLWRPEAGGKFGTMRLTTLGRRSGRPRVATLGYYEDGPNLVTLAMNGWAAPEPAWWLNLRAHPDATVDLADGPRPVRARAAAGAERARLWARFRDFPGWGADLDALAARRATATAAAPRRPATSPTAAPTASATRSRCAARSARSPPCARST